MSTLRVMTYNVRSLRDDVDALADVVSDVQPDVVAVQEAPRFLRWRSKRAALARRCGLLVGTADRTAGLFVMTAMRVQVVGSTYTLLPKASRLHHRAVVTADVVADGARWTVASVHFSVDAAQRREHLPAVWAALASAGGALVVAGDINEEPGDPVFDELAHQMQDCFAVAGSGPAPTSPAVAPRRRLDAIFAAPTLTVESCEVVDVPVVERASDHRPVVAVLRQSPT